MKMISFFWRASNGKPRPFNTAKFKQSLLCLLCVFSMSFILSFSANAQGPTSTCDDPIEVSSTICGNDTNPNTPSGLWGAIPASGVQTLLFGFPGGAFIEIDFNCLADDVDAVGDLEIRLASSAFVLGANPCSIYLENVYDVRDSDGNESPGLLTILVEFTGCSNDTEAPVVTCTEFTATFDDCPVGFGPNTPNGNWIPIPASGMINNAVGGIFTSVLDVSSCITDMVGDSSVANALEGLEYTLVDSYSENVVPGCSIDLINEFGVRDACGNVAANTFIFRGTIQFDGPAPVITCPANVGVECGESIDPADTGMATATSGCGTPTVTFVDVLAPACGSTAVITRTWTATDGCGQTSTCEQIITTFDTMDPVAPAAPAPVTVECDAIPMPEVLMAMDACEGMVMGVAEDVITDGACENAYTIMRTWTFADECGNDSEVSQMITVEDTTPPDVTCTEFSMTFTACPDPIFPNTPSGDWFPVPANGTFLTAVGGSFIQTVDLNGCVTDNCSDFADMEWELVSSYEENRVPGCSVDIINEIGIRDGCENESMTTIIVRSTLQFDGPAPVITCPADAMLECGDSSDPMDTGMATATSDCGTPTVTWADVFVPGCLPTTGVITRTWTATDGCGTTSTCEQTITIDDTMNPRFADPADEVINTSTAGIVCPYPTATISLVADPDHMNPLTPGSDFMVHGATFQVPTDFDDSCDPNPQIYVNIIREQVATMSNEPCTRVIRVVWSVEDACGNERLRRQLFTINDDVAPVLTVPVDTEVACGEDTSPTATGMATALDGCQGDTPVTFNDVSDVTQCDGGTIVRTWISEDVCGNADSLDQTIVVLAPAGPTIVCPMDMIVECSADIVTNADDAIVTTECDLGFNTVVTGPVVNGDEDCPMTTYTYTYTVTDDCGRTASCEQVFTIENDGPTITCPMDMIVECAADIVVDPADATVVTSCTLGFNTVITGPVVNGDEDCPMTTYTYTYTVTDDCGRTASCEQVFTIENDGPTITCPMDMIVECAADIVVDPADATVVTSCTLGFNTVITGPVVNGAPDCPGTTHTFTYTTTDDCGRSVSCEQVFTIQNMGPVVVCPADQIVQCFEDIVADPADLVVTTSCGLGFFAYVKQPLITGGIPGCDGTVYTYIYKVTDDCGRTASCEQQFIIENNAPTVTVPAGGTVNCSADIEVSESDATVTTDCAGDFTLNVLGPVLSGPANCPGTTYTYTYRVKDFCNRIVEEERVFTIGNNGGPIITAIPLNFNSECEVGPSLDEFKAESSCGDGVETSVSDPTVIGTPGCSGTRLQYTYTATDACGRTASHVQTITIQNDGPVIECPETLQIFNCEDGDKDHLIEAWIASVTATSACGGSLDVRDNYNGNAGMCINNGFTNVTFFATDQCGRTTSCVGTIIITDTEAPIIYQAPTDVLVPCNGVTQDRFNEWISTQGGAEAVDGCWGNNISWSTNPSNPQLNCAGGPQAIVVEFIARDGCGNTSSVTGIFNTKVQPSMVNISGQINREDAEPVASVGMRISGGSAGVPDMNYTENGGAYGFPELEYEEHLVVSPEKNDDPLNGVSTYDLILLKKHILQTETLDSPYKRIAADVNGSGSISTFDLVLLRRLILHVDTEFTANTSWRFVEADFVFPNADNPFETAFPETFNLLGLEEEQADFIGVKIGDLDLNAIVNTFSGDVDDRSSLEDLTFEVADQALKAGEEYRIDFTAQNFEQINGFQFTLNVDQTAVEFLQIADADLSNFDENNYGLGKADEGAITVSWDHNDFQNLRADEVAFSLVLTAKNDVQLSEVLSITSEFTRAEAYQSDELMNVNLAFENNGTVETAERFKLFQNQPNPFKETTMIGFNLPEAGAVSLNVYDFSGRLIYTQEGDFAKGYNQMNLDRANLSGGILYYHLNTATDSDSKKMIVIE